MLSGSWPIHPADRKQAADSGFMPLQGLLSDRMFVGRCVLDRVPNPVIPEPPTIRAGVPLDLSLRRPRRWRPPRRRRWRRPPRRRWSVTRRAAVVVVVPVTAAVPVLVRAPAWVPLVARAPVMVIHRCRRRRRVGSARCQAERGQGHAASRQGASAQTKPRFLRVGIHAPENSPWECTQNPFGRFAELNPFGRFAEFKSCSQLGFMCG
jgi:hypothetical protein